MWWAVVITGWVNAVLFFMAWSYQRRASESWERASKIWKESTEGWKAESEQWKQRALGNGRRQ